MTWDRRLYFPSEGRCAEDFFRPKNPTASAGFEPTNLGTKGQHSTRRPPNHHTFYIMNKWINKPTSKKKITKTICDSVNRTRLPKKFLLPDWARQDNQVTYGDCVEYI